jgi:hypothetical protein
MITIDQATYEFMLQHWLAALLIVWYGPVNLLLYLYISFKVLNISNWIDSLPEARGLLATILGVLLLPATIALLAFDRWAAKQKQHRPKLG